MSGSRGVAVLVLVITSLVWSSHAHLCIIHPRQRGDLDISSAGSHTCFRHGANCGGEAAGSPVATLAAGQTLFVQWQQNFNHYEVGHPGFMDIAIATSENSSEYMFLTGFGDINWHQQSHQQNYTVPVVVPDIECERCVIRARYSAHKPGETTFYQCSDVAVKRTRHTPQSDIKASKEVPDDGNLREVARYIATRHTYMSDEPIQPSADTSGLYGLTCNPLESAHMCGFVRIDPYTGIISKIGGEHYGVDAAGPLPSDLNPGPYILDQVVAHPGHGSNLVYYLLHSGTVDDNSQSVIAVKTDDGGVLQTYPLKDVEPVNALIMTGSENIAFQIYPDKAEAGSYVFRWAKANLETGELVEFFRPAKSEPLYVNYQWSTYDSKANIIYYLMGNENAPYDLTARLYAVSLQSGAHEIAPVTIDTSKYTMGTVQYDAVHDRLVALSPGLYTTGSPPWFMVSINPSTGAVEPICQVAPSGIFRGDYTGGIFFLDSTSSTFFARLRALTQGPLQAEVFASISLSTSSCEVRFSRIGNFYHIHNLAFLKTSS